MTAQNIIQRWDAVRTRLLETVDKFGDDELDFRPFPTSWSVRSLMLHIAHEIHHRAELSLILGMLGKQGLNA